MTTWHDEGDPILSVIIASYNSQRTIERCLDSLRGQKADKPFEVILVDSSNDRTADLVRQSYPEVRLITSASRLFCGDARNLGLREARADIIAFLDADCSVGADWVDSVVGAHHGPYPLIGGIVENGNIESRVAWAYYFCEFSLWLPRLKGGVIPEAAGCSLSLKRKAYEDHGPFLEGTYCSDTAFQWRVRMDRQRIWLEPSIRVFHRALYGVLDYLRHVTFHRRCYARVKVRERRLGPARRLGHSLLTPALPILLLAVISGRVARSRRFARKFVASLPLILAGLCARAWGEFLGYVAP